MTKNVNLKYKMYSFLEKNQINSRTTILCVAIIQYFALFDAFILLTDNLIDVIENFSYGIVWKNK